VLSSSPVMLRITGQITRGPAGPIPGRGGKFAAIDASQAKAILDSPIAPTLRDLAAASPASKRDHNSEGVHRCCCLCATSNHAEMPLLFLRRDLDERLVYPKSRLVRCGYATYRSLSGFIFDWARHCEHSTRVLRPLRSACVFK